jgi:hypothetical protein
MTLPPPTTSAGAAFLLQRAPKKALTLRHPEGVVVLREGAPYVTVNLAHGTQPDLIRVLAWRVVQESFDVHAATNLEAIAAYDGECEYLTWSDQGDGYRLTIVETDRGTWSVNASATTGAAEHEAVPIAAYDPAFRFYRQALLSDDLFDARRLTGNSTSPLARSGRSSTRSL